MHLTITYIHTLLYATICMCEVAFVRFLSFYLSFDGLDIKLILKKKQRKEKQKAVRIFTVILIRTQALQTHIYTENFVCCRQLGNSGKWNTNRAVRQNTNLVGVGRLVCRDQESLDFIGLFKHYSTECSCVVFLLILILRA